MGLKKMIVLAGIVFGCMSVSMASSEILKDEKVNNDLKPILYGDANNDGKVNNRDSARILQYVEGWDVSINKENADVNLDGKITKEDSEIILNYLTGKKGYEKLPYAEIIMNVSHSYSIDVEMTINVLYGDANKDGVVNTRDSARILQHVEGWDVSIEENNADVNSDGQITKEDAQIIHRHLAGWTGYEKLPCTIEITDGILYGDANKDGRVNNRDSARIQQHVSGWTVEIDKMNADVNLDGQITKEDSEIILNHLALKKGYEKLPCEKTILYGDANNDGKINNRDSTVILQYVGGRNVSIEKENADINLDGKITKEDAQIILKYLAGNEGYEKLPLITEQ